MVEHSVVVRAVAGSNPVYHPIKTLLIYMSVFCYTNRMDKNILKNGAINAGATAAYIIAIASFLFRAQYIFGGKNEEDILLIPIIMLMLLVISAAVTGFTVFGRPAMWYIDGKKKEAVTLLGTTIGFLALIAFFFISIAIF